jgi:hypothetical protein
MRQLELRFPSLVQAKVKLPELDLIHAVSQREPERRRLLAEAKRQGYVRDCVLALRLHTTGPSLYFHMFDSWQEAAEYMAKVDAE